MDNELVIGNEWISCPPVWRNFVRFVKKDEPADGYTVAQTSELIEKALVAYHAHREHANKERSKVMFEHPKYKTMFIMRFSYHEEEDD